MTIPVGRKNHSVGVRRGPKNRVSILRHRPRVDLGGTACFIGQRARRCRQPPDVCLGVSSTFDIAARGRVAEIPVERGQNVAAGAVLVKIDNPETVAKNEQAYTLSKGKAIYAAGVQFAPVHYDGQTCLPGQGNNLYIFPPVGMAIFATQAKQVSDEMFIEAAQAVADQVPPELLKQGILEVDIQTAARVAKLVFELGLARVGRPADMMGQSIFTLVVTEEWFASANFRETELDHIAVGSCAVVYSLIDRRVAIRGKVDGIGFGVTDQDRVNVPRGVPYVAKSVNWVRVEQRFPVRIRLEHPAENLMRLGASAVVEIRPGDKC